MDASVNMKMTPDEHRLIRNCVIETKAEADRIVALKVGDPEFNSHIARAMRERSARLADLLVKL